MIRRPPRSTRLTHSFPTRRSSDLRLLDRRIEELVASDRAARAPTLPVRRSHAAAFAPGDEDEEAVFGLDRAHSAATQRRGASRSSFRTGVVTHSSLARMESGRESCRGGVCPYGLISGVAGTLKKKKQKRNRE